jgi:molecular chaperone DnaJ
MPRDYYEVLGVSRSADEAEIKKTFRRLARELHPDVNSDDPETEEKFKEAAEAYEVLSDPERRATYDRYGHAGLRSGGYEPSFGSFGSFADVFDAFFGGGDPFGFRGGRGGAMQGSDVGVEVEISLAEAAAGASVQVAYDAVVSCEHCGGSGAEPGTELETCPRCGGAGQLRTIAQTAFGQLVRTTVCDTCHGEGQVPRQACSVCGGRGRTASRRTLAVDIPAGIADGQRIRLSGRGHAGERGGPPGDLYVLVRVAEDERFVRDGNDLVSVLDVPAPLAALGARLPVETLDGEEEIEIPAGTQPGEVLTLRERGMPALRQGSGRRRRGDQRLVVNVVIPRRLTAEQRELLEQLAESLTEENLSSDEGLVSKLRRAFRG